MKNNFNQIMKQAQQMQLSVTALQNELATRELDSSIGGGAIRIKINGKQEILSIKINRECIDLLESFEQLLITAVNQAVKESNDMVSTAVSKVTGGLKIPGLF
ncbi:MAG: YbaB/EbfC family nucleoid-associated protein [Oligoflexia bacterium]|nr:YbaB/EbfC family nucleoid-associated protein [Oligoflexia bacterium]